MKPVCYRIELPVSGDHAEALTEEMLRQGNIADNLGLTKICQFYEDKLDFFEEYCFDNLMEAENG